MTLEGSVYAGCDSNPTVTFLVRVLRDISCTGCVIFTHTCDPHPRLRRLHSANTRVLHTHGQRSIPLSLLSRYFVGRHTYTLSHTHTHTHIHFLSLLSPPPSPDTLSPST
jgi:hypothetical protein